MKKFSVLITTSFDGYVEIDAHTAEDARAKAMEMVENGEFNALDFEPFTEIPFAEEIKERGDRDYKDGGFVNATEERKFNEDMEGK